MKFIFLDDDMAVEIARVFAEMNDEQLEKVMSELEYVGKTSRTIRKINIINEFEPKVKRIKPRLRLLKTQKEEA